MISSIHGTIINFIKNNIRTKTEANIKLQDETYAYTYRHSYVKTDSFTFYYYQNRKLKIHIRISFYDTLGFSVDSMVDDQYYFTSYKLSDIRGFDISTDELYFSASLERTELELLELDIIKTVLTLRENNDK